MEHVPCNRSSAPVSTTDPIDELRDINERLLLSGLREQEASEAAQRDRAQLGALIATLRDGVVIADGDRRIVMMNEAARTLMGIGPGVDVGWREVAALDFRHANMTHLAACEQPLVRAMAGEVVVDAEMLLVGADGSVRCLATSCTSTRTGGDIALAIAVFRDVTERRRLEQRLVQAGRLAAVGTLAAGVAHEINNPLSFVMSNIELVIEELRALGDRSSLGRMAELEGMLLDAQRGAERVRKIVRSLKTFSSTEEPPRTAVDVHAALDLAVGSVEATRHRVRVVKEYGPVPIVDADETQLSQAFVNLLANAAEAFPGAADTDEIRIVTSTDAAGRALIEIRDTGRGIPADIVPYVFEPFFTTKAVGGGTGLGLSICRNIVVALGGEIDVTSREGRGTTLRIALPPSPSARPSAPTAAPPSPREAPTRAARVLVVDDEPGVGAALKRLLRGHDVTAVVCAQDALNLVASGRKFDVILSDLMMPKKSGMDLYNELSQTSPEHAQRIVFVSGGAFTRDAADFLERVGNQRVEKPFTAATIRSIVRTFIGPRE